MISNSKIIVFFSTGFILVLLLIILLISFSLKQFDELQNKVQTVESEYHKKTEALSSFAQNSYKRTITLLKMYESSDPFERNELFDQFFILAHKVATSNRTFLSFDLPANEKAIHMKISQRMKKSSTLRSHIADLLLEGKDDTALDLIVNESVKSQESVMEIVEQLQAQQRNNHNQYLLDLRQQQKKNMLRVSILGFALFMIFSIVVFFVIRYILRKENIIVKRAEVTLDSISHGVITTDTLGKVDYLNPYAKIVLESMGCFAKGKYFDNLGILYKKGEKQPLTKIVANAVDDPKIIQHYNQCYLKSIDIDAVLWVAATIASIMGRNNEFLGVVIIITDISEVNALNEKLEHEANHDSLTSLYNRKIVEEKIRDAVEKSNVALSSSIILYIDLDNFKQVNDNAGHHAGDRLLIEFSQLLKTQIREYDVVGRIGGDEFVILLYRCTLEQGKEVASKIINSVNNYRLQWEGEEYSVGTSIGITSIDGKIKDFQKITKNADKALYAAKQAGKNRYHIA